MYVDALILIIPTVMPEEGLQPMLHACYLYSHTPTARIQATAHASCLLPLQSYPHCTNTGYSPCFMLVTFTVIPPLHEYRLQPSCLLPLQSYLNEKGYLTYLTMKQKLLIVASVGGLMLLISGGATAGKKKSKSIFTSLFKVSPILLVHLYSRSALYS